MTVGGSEVSGAILGVCLLLGAAVWGFKLDRYESANRNFGRRRTQFLMACFRLLAAASAAALFSVASQIFTDDGQFYIDGSVLLMIVLASASFLIAMVCEDRCKRSVDLIIKKAG